MGNKNKARSAVVEGFENTGEGAAFKNAIKTRVESGVAALGLGGEGPAHSRRPGQSFNGGGM